MRSFERIDVPLNQKMYKNQTGGQLVRLLNVSRLLKKNSQKYLLPTLI